MARRKVRLAYITNDAQRKASYRKRKKGLLKKLEELTLLCSVKACAIMYSAFDMEPVVWPSVEGMQDTVARFRSLPNVEQTRRMLNQERFVQERIHKLSTTLIKLKKENREKEMTTLMYHILDGEQIIEPLNIMDLNDLGWVINRHLGEITNQIETIKKEGGASSSSMAQPVTNDHRLVAQEVPVFHIPIGASSRGVVALSMFNFQGEASSSSVVAPNRFNFEGAHSIGCAGPPRMYNLQHGDFSYNAMAPVMLNDQERTSRSCVVATSDVTFQDGLSRDNTEASVGVKDVGSTYEDDEKQPNYSDSKQVVPYGLLESLNEDRTIVSYGDSLI